MSIQNN
jgi:transposase InsO family protein